MYVFNFERRTQFFKDLEKLMDSYPEIKDYLKRVKEEFESVLPEDYPKFDPESPVTYNGVVLLVNVCNMEYHETTMRLSPWTQSSIVTCGLINDAAEGSGYDRG